MTQYLKISKRIDYLEKIDIESPTGIQLSKWCSDQISWAYRWKKLTYSEMEELCRRMILIFGGKEQSI